MTKIIRTPEQINALIKAIKDELKDMPDTDIWGDSNDKAEAQCWVRELKLALKEGRVEDEWSETGYWLTNEKGTLGIDYGVT